MESFEEKLRQLTKPDISGLKHDYALSKAIMKAGDSSAVGLWWLGIPLYIVAVLLMKSLFVPHTTLFSNLHEFVVGNHWLAIGLFVAVPAVFIVVNALVIRTVHLAAGRQWTIGFVRVVWLNLAIILLSFFIIAVYL